MFPADLLYLMAEVSIATVALSGITMVLATSTSVLTPERVAEITIQLRMASVVTVFCLFPLVAFYWGLDQRVLWRLSSGLYLTTLLGIFYWNYRHPLQLPTDFICLGGAVGLVALLLLGANVWFGEAWPHLTQLFLGWLGSLFLFLVFIHEVLIGKTQDHDGG